MITTTTRQQDDVPSRDGLYAMQASKYVIPERAPIDAKQSRLGGADFMKLIKSRDGVKNLGTCRGGRISADTDVIFYTNEAGEIEYMSIVGGYYPTALLDKVIAYAVTESTFMRDNSMPSAPRKSLEEIKIDLNASIPEKVAGVLSQE